MRIFSFFAEFWKRLRGGAATKKLLSAPVDTEPLASEKASPEPTPVTWLSDLASAVSDALRIEEVGQARFWEAIDSLYERGDELLAAQWVQKFHALALVTPEQRRLLQVRIIRIFESRGDLSPVFGELELLQEDEEHGAWVHFLLAEHHGRRGNDGLAQKHYESVLALDLNYPNARQRFERLRKKHSAAVPNNAQTLAGPAALRGNEAGRYLLVRELGRGGSGVAYLARDLELEREVAVKLLHPHLSAAHQRGALLAFFEEARVAASLRHPNIVAILDLDEKARRIVMELCNGGTLRALLRDRAPRSLRSALSRHAQILSALDAAHARGVIHRDVKPANLMFRRDPESPGSEIVLGDFGIAHLPEAREGKKESRGQDNKAIGTMAYMAPEQRRGQASAASDLYASAVVLFELLTGRYPWKKDVLLAGVRTPEDFQLPGTLSIENAALQAGLQAHLSSLGHPEQSERPDTTSAMKQARRLRDLAMIYAD